MCKHEKEKVEWDDAPNLADNFAGDIPWYGTCSCGTRVFEIYAELPEVYEA